MYSNILIEKKGLNINFGDKGKLTPLCYTFDYFKPNHGDVNNVLSYLLNQAPGVSTLRIKTVVLYSI
jgi:hypothetical protein